MISKNTKKRSSVLAFVQLNAISGSEGDMYTYRKEGTKLVVRLTFYQNAMIPNIRPNHLGTKRLLRGR